MKKNILKIWKSNYVTYAMVVIFFLVMQRMISMDSLSRLMKGQIIPICVYIVAAVSLNLTVGVLGELSLGHAGFMSVGCFAAAIAAGLMKGSVASDGLRLALSIVVGALAATIVGFLVGLPVLRLNGDYLAIVTLACGEIIKSLLTNVYLGKDETGLHLNLFTKTMNVASKDMILRGPQGIKNSELIGSFLAGIILVLICLVAIDNLVNSKTGRAVMALRDNKIAARSIGINITRYKMLAFVTSAAMAGAAGALFGLSQTAVLPGKFDFNTSILVLVFVVMGGLGNMRGSMLAAALLTVLPEKIRFLQDYRMIVYAVVLILVMLGRNSTAFRFVGRLLHGKKAAAPAVKPQEGGM